MDKSCNVHLTADPLPDPAGKSDALESISASGGARPDGGASTLDVHYGNIIHTSQTMQDIVTIDIAKYQYSHDRVWDTISYSYFKIPAWWMRSCRFCTNWPR